ncbi:MAG: PAS domain S-box protein, partial [Chloroflexi bacterium]|nr:PAS domain S-box protein [Chloroflexota bacterium]
MSRQHSRSPASMPVIRQLVQTIGQAQDRVTLYQAVVDQTLAGVGAALVTLSFAHPERNELIVEYAAGLDSPLARAIQDLLAQPVVGWSWALPEGTLGRAYRERVTVEHDSLCDVLQGRVPVAACRAAGEAVAFRRYVGLPLLVAEHDESVGQLAFFFAGPDDLGPQTPDLEILGEIAATAMRTMQTVDTLRQRTQEWHSIFQTSPSATLTVDNRQIIASWNRAAEQMTGYTAQEMIGQSCFKLQGMPCLEKCGLYAPDVPKPIIRKECTVVAKDGRTIIISKNVAELRDEAGRVIGGVESFDDVTQYRQATRELEDLKEFHEDIVQNMAEGIVMTDPAGRITFVNPAAANLLGYAADELTGQHWTRVVPPDQQPIVQAADERRAQGHADRYELELVCQDGTRATVLVAGSPRLEAGQFVGTLSVFTDIGERKQLEAILLQAKEDWERTFDAVPDMVFLLDAESRITGLNRAAAKGLGVSFRDAIGRHCYELLHGTQAPIPGCPYQRTLATAHEAQQDVEEPLLGKVLDVTTTPIIEPDGRVTGCVHVARDITERKHMEQALEQRARRLTAINAVAAALSQTLDLDTLLPLALEQVLEAMLTDQGGLYLLDETRQSLDLVAQQGMPENQLPHYQQLPVQSSLPGQAVQTRQPVLVQDMQPAHAAPEAPPVAFLAVPLIASDQVHGVLNVVRVSGQPFSTEDVDLLATVAQQVASAIENARLYKAVREREELLRMMTEQSSELLYLQDLEGTPLYVSPSVERLLGYTPAEYIEARVAGQILVRDHPYTAAVVQLWRDIRAGQVDDIPVYKAAVRHRSGDLRIHEVHESF